MKRFLSVALLVALMVLLLAACGEPKVETPKTLDYTLGDTGVVVTLPTELGFERMESELNEFFGVGANGEWSIIVNMDENDAYTLEEFIDYTAKANGADGAKKTANGNFYFTYEDEGYSFYTVALEHNSCYYRVTFYCFSDVWNDYKDNFVDWATTVRIATDQG